MKLCLMRHGHAEEYHPDGDAGRRLTPEGKSTVQRVAEGLARERIAFSRIISSPYARAAETAKIVAEKTGYAGKLLSDTRLIPSGGFEEISDLIREYSEAEPLLLVGHQPLIGETAARLTSQGNLRLAVSPGTIIVVQVGGFRPYANGVLVGLHPPALG